MKINDDVLKALKENRPVVALESTIISHGMPYPRNVEVALAVEDIIRREGAVPATIGIIDGEPIIGMNPDEIEEFGKRKGILKVSRRDLPYVKANKLWGATTVAATMILANLAGIKVFVTGGIGGVHRGASETFDISADLDELSKTPIAVVCAGPKAILDIGLTMEYLETKGVLVLGYKTDTLPCFYTRSSNVKLEYNVNSPLEIAKVIKAKDELKLDNGILVTNPIPDQYSLDHSMMEETINKAIAKMKSLGIKGKEETPFLLKEIVELTHGESLEANIALVENNAKLGANIAIELAKL